MKPGAQFRTKPLPWRDRDAGGAVSACNAPAAENVFGVMGTTDTRREVPVSRLAFRP